MNNLTETAERTIRDVCAGRPCLSACLARVRGAPPCAACPPQGAARPFQVIRWAVGVLAAVVVALLAFCAFGEVVCEWNGQAYVCSGFGEEIIVKPGDPNNIGQEVVTNVYGCCTNCTAIPPQALSNLLNEIKYKLEDISQNRETFDALFDSTKANLRSQINEIDGYQNSGYLEHSTDTLNKWATVSNYIMTVDNGQTRVVRSVYGFPSQSATPKTRFLTANDAIYFYATGYEKPLLENELENVTSMEGEYVRILTHVDDGVQMIDEILPQLAKAPDCSSLSNGCGAVTGRWCTEEQGEAMIKLLQEQVYYLLSISNHLHSVDLHLGGLYRTFMTLRGGIPAEESLDKSWQDIYLSNSTGSFDYRYTNIAERIELLLYGLSGVGTNTQLFTSLDSPIDSEDTAQSEYDRVHAEFEDIDASFDTGFANMHTLFGKLQSLFSAFSGLVGRTLAPDETYISNFSFNLGDDSIAVPAVTVGGDVGIANQLQTICRGGMIGLYWLVAGILGVKFYIWFFAKVVYFLRWCWELLQGLFS